MNLILWILFGALVGWLGSILADNNDSSQAGMMTVYGVVGGVVGGWLANIVCNETLNNFNIYSVLSAVLGAALIAWAFRLFTLHSK